jgi:hypothetical protein
MMKFGKFQYGPKPQGEDNAKVMKLQSYLDGGIYFGEGNLEHNGKFIRDGRGIDIFSSDAIYEAWWKEGKKNGRGRSFLV